jgi:sensor histidine kinase YesM
MLIVTMPRWILLAATLPIVLRIGVGSSVPRERLRTMLLHLALFLAISWLHAAITAWATALVQPMSYFFPWSARLIRAWYNTLPTMVSLYSAVLIAAWGISEARERQRRTLRAAQLETQLQAAQLEALRAKLQPHFLYNTLNGIAALVADVQPARAVAAIEQLSELLHVALRDNANETVTVREEVTLAEQYLALQRMRFGERLCYSVDIDPDAAQCMVPVLLLQPVVENAVVHSLDAGVEQLQIVISAQRVAAGLELRVDNNGMSIAHDVGASTARSTGSHGNGVGLAATHARLLTAFGDRASLRLVSREGGGVSVRIGMPASFEVPSAPAVSHARGEEGSTQASARRDRLADSPIPVAVR